MSSDPASLKITRDTSLGLHENVELRYPCVDTHRETHTHRHTHSLVHTHRHTLISLLEEWVGGGWGMGGRPSADEPSVS